VCIGCGICAEFCPGDVMVMDGTKKARIAYPKDCWTCFSCEIVVDKSFAGNSGQVIMT
jgi:NAD-dependent dihydropyrimidine dehydrogenase PreA subunit